MKFGSSVEIKKSPYNLQVINFSSALFKQKMNELFDVLVTNLIYLKNIDPNNTTKFISNWDTQVQSIIITYPLLFLPAFDVLEDKLNCKAFSFNNKNQKANRYGKVLSIN